MGSCQIKTVWKLKKMQEKISKPIWETWKGSKRSLPHWGWKSQWGGPWCLLSVPTGLPVSPSDRFITQLEILKAIDQHPHFFRSHLSSITTFNPIYSITSMARLKALGKLITWPHSNLMDTTWHSVEQDFSTTLESFEKNWGFLEDNFVPTWLLLGDYLGLLRDLMWSTWDPLGHFFGA